MPPALAYEGVQRAIRELGIAAAFAIGPAEVKDGLRAPDVTAAEAHALEVQVDTLTVLIGRN